MRRMFHLFTYLLAAVVLGASQMARAEGPGGSAPLKVLGDHLLVPFTYKTEGLEKQSHFIVDLGSPDYIALHGTVYQSLPGGGEKIQFVHDDLSLDVDFSKVRNLGQGRNICDILTARYDSELENIDVTAIVGFEFLKDYAININMEDKAFSMTPSSANHTAQIQRQYLHFVDGVTVTGNNVYVPVSANGKRVGSMELQTAGYHTSIDPELASGLDKSSDIIFGEPGGEQPLSGMVALRTQPMPQATDKTPANRVMRSGIGLWASFDVTIDPKAGYLAMTPIRNNNYHDGDAAFYKASMAATWDQLYQYLQAFPKDRNVEEAVDEMFTIGINERAPADKLITAIEVGLGQVRERRKFEYVQNYCLAVSNAQPSIFYRDTTIGVCEKAMEYVAYSQMPGARQGVQLILGQVFLDKGDAQQAWMYYLSASFNGDPDLDGPTQMGLAQCYEAMKRYRRAYATYQRLAKGWTKQQLAARGLDVVMARIAKKLDANDPLLTGEQ